jgi:branched-chain amino acid transport system ATP-binding protein
MLRVESISAAYGRIRALENVSLQVAPGSVACILGSNGAGKTTTLNCISGVVRLAQGSISFDGQTISALSADEIVARGIVQVPEGRQIFPDMVVEDNVLLGAWLHRRDRSYRDDLARVYTIFPRLKERRKQLSGTLSGGEQQMLMFGRALMSRPKIILLDEPSLGLSPILVDAVFETVRNLRKDGTTFLIVEQNARMALAVSDYGYVLENGEIRLHGPVAALADHPEIRAAYLGG